MDLYEVHGIPIPIFIARIGRFARIARMSDSRESPDSCESCESICANHATKPPKLSRQWLGNLNEGGQKNQWTPNTLTFFWRPLRDNRPGDEPPHPSQRQTGRNGDFTVEFRCRFVPGMGPGLSKGRVPFAQLIKGRFLLVPNIVPPKMFMFIGFSCLINVGAKKWTQVFFSQTFRALPGYPSNIPGYPAQKAWFPWVSFEGHAELFGPHPSTWKTPTPPENIRTQKFGFVLVFVPDNGGSQTEAD